MDCSTTPYDAVREAVMEAMKIPAPKGSISGQLAKEDFWQLLQDLDLDDDSRYPRISYNSATQAFLVVFAPSPICESFVTTFKASISDALRASNNIHRAQYQIRTHKKYCHFNGEYWASQKTPDLALCMRNNRGFYDPKLILEVGVSKPCNELIEDVNLWLEGNPKVKTVVIVKVGRIQDCLMEIWVRDPETNLPKQVEHRYLDNTTPKVHIRIEDPRLNIEIDMKLLNTDFKSMDLDTSAA